MKQTKQAKNANRNMLLIILVLIGVLIFYLLTITIPRYQDQKRIEKNTQEKTISTATLEKQTFKNFTIEAPSDWTLNERNNTITFQDANNTINGFLKVETVTYNRVKKVAFEISEKTLSLSSAKKKVYLSDGFTTTNRRQEKMNGTYVFTFDGTLNNKPAANYYAEEGTLNSKRMEVTYKNNTSKDKNEELLKAILVTFTKKEKK